MRKVVIAAGKAEEAVYLDEDRSLIKEGYQFRDIEGKIGYFQKVEKRGGITYVSILWSDPDMNEDCQNVDISDYAVKVYPSSLKKSKPSFVKNVPKILKRKVKKTDVEKTVSLVGPSVMWKDGQDMCDMAVDRDDYSAKKLVEAIKRYSGGDRIKYDIVDDINDIDGQHYLFVRFDPSHKVFMRNMFRDIFDDEPEVDNYKFNVKGGHTI